MANKFITKCVSTWGTINRSDTARGLFMAFGAGVIATVGQGLEAGHLPGEAQIVIACKTGFAAGCIYLLKQLFSGPKKTNA